MLGTISSSVASLTTALVATALLGPSLPLAVTGTSGECAGVTVVVDASALPSDADASVSTGADLPSRGVVGCADDASSGAVDGLAALRDAGVTVDGTAQWGTAFVCRVDGRPGPDEDVVLPDGTVVREACARTPSTKAYWSLWTAAPGVDPSWEYAQTGVSDLELAPGAALGLVFSVGQDAPSPPALSPSDARTGERPAGWSAPAGAPVDGAPAEVAEAEERDSGMLLVVALALVVVLVSASVVLARRRR